VHEFVSRATKNKSLATMRILFRLAADKWEWIAHLAPDHLAEHANMATIWAQPDAGNVQTLAA